MKKLILLFLFASAFAFSQNTREAYFYIDPSNAIRGSEVNKPALNYIIGFSDDYNGFKPLRIGFLFEHFEEIKYYEIANRLDWVVWPYFFQTDDHWFNFIVGTQVGAVFRGRDLGYAQNSLNIGYNAELKIQIFEWLKVGVLINREYRKDVSQSHSDSMYLGLIYNF